MFNSTCQISNNIQNMVANMKTKLILTALLVSISTCTNAEVSVSWFEPENYKDVETTLETQEKYQEKVFDQLTGYIKKLAVTLPKDNKLWLKVTDLDMAGRVLPGYVSGIDHARDIRVIERIDFPKISFDMRITDASGKVITNDKISLKDMSFLDSFRTLKEKRDELSFEKRMLKDWFQKRFPREVAEK